MSEGIVADYEEGLDQKSFRLGVLDEILYECISISEKIKSSFPSLRDTDFSATIDDFILYLKKNPESSVVRRDLFIKELGVYAGLINKHIAGLNRSRLKGDMVRGVESLEFIIKDKLIPGGCRS